MQFSGQIDSTPFWYTAAFIPISDIPFNHFEQWKNFRQSRVKVSGSSGQDRLAAIFT